LTSSQVPRNGLQYREKHKLRKHGEIDTNTESVNRDRISGKAEIGAHILAARLLDVSKPDLSVANIVDSMREMRSTKTVHARNFQRRIRLTLFSSGTNHTNRYLQFALGPSFDAVAMEQSSFWTFAAPPSDTIPTLLQDKFTHRRHKLETSQYRRTYRRRRTVV